MMDTSLNIFHISWRENPSNKGGTVNAKRYMDESESSVFVGHDNF